MCLCASVCSRNMVLPVVCDNRNCYTDTTVDISWIEFILALHFPAVQLLSLHSHVDNVYSHPLLTTSFMFPFLYMQDTGWILLVFHTCIYLHPHCQQTDTNTITQYYPLTHQQNSLHFLPVLGLNGPLVIVILPLTPHRSLHQDERAVLD